jgi:hypothetical protein
MEARVMELALKGFGAAPTPARVQVMSLSPADRFKRAAGAMAAGLIAAAIAIPIPLVHFVLVPAALVLGFGFAVSRMGQREIFRGGSGSCPFCSTEQKFPLTGRFRLPKTLHCSSCQRQLVLDQPTSESRRSPRESPSRTPS